MLYVAATPARAVGGIVEPSNFQAARSGSKPSLSAEFESRFKVCAKVVSLAGGVSHSA